jgi:hypothetical protein
MPHTNDGTASGTLLLRRRWRSTHKGNLLKKKNKANSNVGKFAKIKRVNDALLSPPVTTGQDASR